MAGLHLTGKTIGHRRWRVDNRSEDRGVIVEKGVGANASFACGLAGDTTCVCDESFD